MPQRNQLENGKGHFILFEHMKQTLFIVLRLALSFIPLASVQWENPDLGPATTIQILDEANAPEKVSFGEFK